MKLEEVQDDLIPGVHEDLQAKFDAERAQFEDIPHLALPSSLTPSDLDRLYKIQSDLSARLHSAGHLAVKWLRIDSRFQAILKRRRYLREKALLRGMIENEPTLKKFRSNDEKKLWVETNSAIQPEIENLEFLADMSASWAQFFKGVRDNMMAQQSLILTHLSILKSHIDNNKHPGAHAL